MDETEDPAPQLIKTRIELERLKKLSGSREKMGRRESSCLYPRRVRDHRGALEGVPCNRALQPVRREPLRLYKWRKRGGIRRKTARRCCGWCKAATTPTPRTGTGGCTPTSKDDGITVSAEYVRRCFLYLGIRAETKHQKKDRERKARDPYPQPHLLPWGDGRSPAPGDSLRHDGVLDAEQVLGSSLFTSTCSRSRS